MTDDKLPSGYMLHSHGFSMALIEIDDFPSERNLHLFWGVSMAMLVRTRWS